MSEHQDSQEKTLDPTQRRKEQAREQGQVVRSRDLSMAVTLVVGTAGVVILGPAFSNHLIDIASSAFTLPRDMLFEPNTMFVYMNYYLLTVLKGLIPFIILVLLIGIIPSLWLGGVIFKFSLLAPKFNRLNPAKNLARIFGVQGLIELIKSIMKLSLVTTMVIVFVYRHLSHVVFLGQEDMLTAIADSLDVLGWSFVALSSVLVLVSIVDVPFQFWRHFKQLKMSREEMKEEFKSTEGKPEVKRRIRMLQQEIARRQMMKQLPHADVVVTNPEHYAVALRYNQNSDVAPILLAKGCDFVAQQIREVAREHDIPIVASPMLARSVYYHTKLNQPIPAGLFTAVAHVLAYVYQLKRYQKRQGPQPKNLAQELPIPEDLRR